MKRMSWDYFLKRRNLSYASFINMNYEMYTNWCHARNIIPTTESIYQEGVEPFLPKVIPSNPRNFDPKSLNRKKKADIIEICILKGVELDGGETKKVLIQKLLDLNNG